MEFLQSYLLADEDLLDFTLDDAAYPAVSASYSSGESAASFGRGTQPRLFPEFVEEELEWLSNKDAFPSVETCFGILSDNPELVNNHSPVSVFEKISVNSNTNVSGTGIKIPTSYPVRARSKQNRRRRRDIFCPWKPPSNNKKGVMAKIGDRRCLHCQTDTTPQWRAGPDGPKTLCNACGVRFKSGRLLPEYRPANSPTFSSGVHSNSHRKVVEMRRKKEAEGM